MKIRNISSIALVALALAVVSCGSNKAVVGAKPASQSTDAPASQSVVNPGLRFVQKVADTRLYQKNIVGDITFNIKAGSVNQTLPGSLRMRKDEVIRIQVMIPVIQTEIARIEFTPDYVLVIDRWHKEYIKADYSQLSFLRENGLDFYSLQSLFWNELLLPGSKKVGEGDLGKFSADLSGQGSEVPVTLTSGKLGFRWNASRAEGRILSALVTYAGGGHGTSTLSWQYADFRQVGVKYFPGTQTFSFATTATGKAQQATVSLRMGSVGTGSDWEARTTPSAKYKKVEAADVFDKILNMR